MSKTRKTYAQLEVLYKTLPTIKCQGLCHEACGPIAMSKVEFVRITRETNSTPEVDEVGTCSLLKDKRCSVYSIRPMICRLWGLVEDLACPFGCVPSRVLTKQESYNFLSKVVEITGSREMKSTIKELEDVLNYASDRRHSSVIQK
jgi:Fe-S-cluster containining protein